MDKDTPQHIPNPTKGAVYPVRVVCDLHFGHKSWRYFFPLLSHRSPASREPLEDEAPATDGATKTEDKVVTENVLALEGATEVLAVVLCVYKKRGVVGEYGDNRRRGDGAHGGDGVCDIAWGCSVDAGGRDGSDGDRRRGRAWREGRGVVARATAEVQAGRRGWTQWRANYLAEWKQRGVEQREGVVEIED